MHRDDFMPVDQERHDEVVAQGMAMYALGRLAVAMPEGFLEQSTSYGIHPDSWVEAARRTGDFLPLGIYPNTEDLIIDMDADTINDMLAEADLAVQGARCIDEIIDETSIEWCLVFLEQSTGNFYTLELSDGCADLDPDNIRLVNENFVREQMAQRTFFRLDSVVHPNQGALPLQMEAPPSAEQVRLW